MRPAKLSNAVERIYSVFGCYPRPVDAQFCTYCHDPEEIDYYRATPLREFDPEMVRRLVWETSDHWQDLRTYKYYFPMILDGIAPPRRCEDMYPEHLFEMIERFGFDRWPDEERDAFWNYVIAVHDALDAVDRNDAREWKGAARKLAGSPFIKNDPFDDDSGGPMPTLIDKPTVIQAAGNKPKRIEEFVGRVNSKTEAVSIARMTSPSGWVEPGQTPEFDEYTIVLRGSLRVTSKKGSIDVQAGQAVITHRGEWVQYSTPGAEGAEYVAVCLPAFSPETVHRD